MHILSSHRLVLDEVIIDVESDDFRAGFIQGSQELTHSLLADEVLEHSEILQIGHLLQGA